MQVPSLFDPQFYNLSEILIFFFLTINIWFMLFQNLGL